MSRYMWIQYNIREEVYMHSITSSRGPLDREHLFGVLIHGVCTTLWNGIVVTPWVNH